MKRLTLIFILLFFGRNFQAQKWGANTFGQFTNEAMDVEIDAAGNSYITGYVTGETAFNTSNVLQTTPGNGDIYVAKYNSIGDLIWWKQFGGNFSDRAYDLAIGPDQNVVVTGQYFGSVTFGTNVLQSSQNSKDIFLVKLNPLGNVLWARSEGGNLSENAYGVTVDHQNNVILTGQFEGTTSIANQSFTSIIDPFNNLPSYDLFISKYDATGNPLWAHAGRAKKEDRGLAVAVDLQDNIFLSGQYSDTLQFAGNTYNNNGLNVGFVSKLSPTGQVLFFNNLRAGSCLPYDLEVNGNNEVVIIGDFLGNMIYFNNGVSNPITNPYQKRIFAIKIQNNGQFSWAYTLGSDNVLSARSISIDGNKNIYITGHFTCNLTQLHVPHTAFWNSVGFKDPYLLKLSNAGQKIYIKQFGGKKDDEGHGVAVQHDEEPILCGSFTNDLNFPTDLITNSNQINTNYSLNWIYDGIGFFKLKGDETRNSFLVKYLDSTVIDYNYFTVPTNDTLVGSINLGQDTVHFCESTYLNYDPMTYPMYGPTYNYVWNTGYDLPSYPVNTNGIYSITVNRIDACAGDQDTIVAIKDPKPNLPLFSDTMNLYVNQQGPFYASYHYCFPDSIGVFYTNLQAGCTVTTYDPSGAILTGLGVNTHFTEGTYYVFVSNGMCNNIGEFNIDFDYSSPPNPIQLGIIFNNNTVVNDTITLCLGDPFSFTGVDYLNIPSPNYQFIQEPHFASTWTVNNSSSSGNDDFSSICTPNVTGWYHVSYHLILGYDNLCGLDTLHFFASDSVYVIVNPRPTFSATISGDNLLCPNGSVFLKVSATHTGFNWSGPGISWVSPAQDSIEVNLPGSYYYEGSISDSVTGCSNEFNFSHYIALKTAPNIMSNPPDGYICPDDSLILTIPNNYVSYQWVGPEGDTLSITNTCYGSDAGFYYCHLIDSELCHLTTPPFEVKEYMTPSILVQPSVYLCQGESITIEVLYSGTASFSWSPISSSANQIVVTQPGTYGVTINQCGFTITESVTIIDGTTPISISAASLFLCYNDTININGSTPNGDYYWSNGATGDNLVVTSPGTYSATVTNEFGCIYQTNELVIAAVDGSEPTHFDSLWVCRGTDVILQDSTGNNLNWYDLDTNFLFSGSQLILTNLQSDTSFLTAYSVQYCSPIFTPVFVGVYSSIGSHSLMADTMMCLNEVIQLNLQAPSHVNFQWFNGNTTSNTIAVAQPGTYHVNVSLCEFNDIDSIIIHDASFTAQIAANEIQLCPGQSITITGSPSNLNYTWIGTFSNSSTLTVSNPGVYSALVTNAFGCTSTTNQIQITNAPNAQAPVVSNVTICIGDDATLISSNGQSINWYSMDTVLQANASTFTLNGVFQDTTVLVSQTNSICPLQYATVNVAVIDPSVPIEIIGDSSLCPSQNLEIHFVGTGSFTWTLPSGTSNTTNNPISIPYNQLQGATNIFLTVANQCSNQIVSDTIIYLTPDSIHLSMDSLVLCAYQTVPISLNISVQDAEWSGDFGMYNGSTFNVNSTLGDGYVYVQAYDLNGCLTNFDSLYLTTSSLSYQILTDETHHCYGDTGFIQLITTSDSLLWNTPIGILDTSYISIIYNDNFDGNYHLTLWDEIGCVYHETVSITYNLIPVFDIGDTIMCLNEVYQNFKFSPNLNYWWQTYGADSLIPITETTDLVLTVSTPQGCSYTDSIHVVAVNCDDVLPNVMTANGDGINDYFVIDEALKFPNNRLIIQNRWGNVVFDEVGYRNTFDGANCVDGVYFYIFYRDSESHTPVSNQGFLQIIR